MNYLADLRLADMPLSEFVETIADMRKKALWVSAVNRYYTAPRDPPEKVYSGDRRSAGAKNGTS